MKKNIPQVSISLASKHHHLLLKAHRGRGRGGGVQWRFAQTFFHRVAQPGCPLKKNGQLKFHNCHNERYIVNCSPCLTYCSGTGTDIYIYHLL